MTIIWTKRALKSFFKVTDYLQEKWGEKELASFVGTVDNVIEQIKKTPNIFEASQKYKNVRKGFITEHNTLYYRIKSRKKVIELILFWDNRQNPDKLQY